MQLSPADIRRNWLKQRTRMLIRACGGLEPASEVCEAECRRYSVPQLGRCQNPNAQDTLPLDILDVLEAHCGQPLVSAALGASTRWQVKSRCLRDEASDAVEVAAELQRHVRTAQADGEIDPKEADQLMTLAVRLKAEADDIIAAVGPLLKRGLT